MIEKEKLSTSDRGRLVTKLDQLIDQFYQQIKKDPAKHAKLGDMLKMIELRQKLLPDQSDQDSFWKMLDRIRRDELTGKSDRVSADRQKTSKAPSTGKKQGSKA
ncbi:MAG: hypothetical protein V3T31_03110 [candidate division Zixibacteria bacterium]